MLPKIIVTTGCSYGKLHDGLNPTKNPELINYESYSNLELVLDLHCSSLGSTFQSLSIIETVDKLLSIGVDSNDIFVLGEFSTIDRKDVVIQTDFLVDFIDNAIVNEVVNGVNYKHLQVDYPDKVIVKHSEYISNLLDKLKVKKFFAGDYAKFNNYYVINPEKKHQPKFPNDAIQSILSNYVNNMDIEIKNVGELQKVVLESMDRAIRYFQNIFSVQEYLKLKGIKYKFCLINNQFSMYDQNGIQKDKLTKCVDNEHYLYQDYVNSKQIWDINSMIKILYNIIDWDNWWFYENKDKNIIWGGIDEYAIDKFGINVYTDRNVNNNLFGQHPNTEVYNKLILEELLKEYFLKKKII